MLRTDRRVLIFLWAMLSVIGIGAEAITWPVAYYKGEPVPVGIDSYYHARRILDTAADPSSFYEFDKHIHAPEGSLLTWPWAYDYGIAWIVRLGMKAGLASNPMDIVAWIPPFAVVFTLGFFLLVCRELRLSTWMTVVAGLCLALAPTTQLLHGVGQIDHHWAEYIFILAALGLGMRWLREPTDRGRSIALGIALGIAPAIHNGMFILQLPLLLTVFALWVQGTKVPTRACLILSATLVGLTLLVALPSLPFRMGRFEFYTLSWFHLYIAASTATLLTFMSTGHFSRRNLAWLFALGAGLLLPIVAQVRHGQAFLAGSISYLDQIAEMMPPIVGAQQMGALFIHQLYSPIFWLLPLTIALCVIGLWRERTSPQLHFWITSLIGIVLLNLQLRLHYFGNFALFLPWLLFAEHLAARKADKAKLIYLLTSLAMLLFYAVPLRLQTVGGVARANDESFVNVRPVLGKLAEACRNDPGIVLADANAGHYIRYYTDCDVIANNFLMTPQHFAKIAEIASDFSLPAAELARRAPHIKYVLIRPLGVKQEPSGTLRYLFFFGAANKLANDLFYDTPERVPSSFHLLADERLKELDNAPYAKLYKIDGTSAPGARE